MEEEKFSGLDWIGCLLVNGQRLRAGAEARHSTAQLPSILHFFGRFSPGPDSAFYQNKKDVGRPCLLSSFPLQIAPQGTMTPAFVSKKLMPKSLFVRYGFQASKAEYPLQKGGLYKKEACPPVRCLKHNQ